MEINEREGEIINEGGREERKRKGKKGRKEPAVVA